MGYAGSAEELIESEILKIAREHAGKRPIVKAVFRGRHPEENSLMYYFVIGREFGLGKVSLNDKDYDEFEGRLAEIEAELFRTTCAEFGAVPCPIELEDAKFSFYGECIYRLEQEKSSKT